MKKRSPAGSIQRKNLMVDVRKIKRLQREIGADSESETVRKAVELMLDMQKALRAARRLRELGTIGDAYHHLSPEPTLEPPVSP